MLTWLHDYFVMDAMLLGCMCHAHEGWHVEKIVSFLLRLRFYVLSYEPAYPFVCFPCLGIAIVPWSCVVKRMQ